jgi:hypothetical protein
MAFCTCYPRRPVGDTEFTVLLVRVLDVSHPLALEGSSEDARELVERFLSKYTKLNPVLARDHVYKISRLAVDFRLEIAFIGKPHGFQAPFYKSL